ncbi:MAG: hypothetical protein QMC96_11850 [Methanomicrobiales archaeon]|nr:hypothetical protein [Methanomicrobiales archaeon]
MKTSGFLPGIAFSALLLVCAGVGPVSALTWDIQTMDTEGDAGVFTSLAMDGDDNPRISNSDGTYSVLQYAAWTGSAWDIEFVSGERNVSYTSLELDSSGYSRIAYYEYMDGDLKYAVWNGSAWDRTRWATPPSLFGCPCGSRCWREAGEGENRKNTIRGA